MVDNNFKCCGIIGPSGSGKTTLIEQLIPLLMPLKIAVLKHSHHHWIGPESSHKDSKRYMQAGALSSLCVPANMPFEEALRQLLSVGDVSAVIVESFRNAPIPKLLYAPNGLDKEWYLPNGIVAQVGDSVEGVAALRNDPIAIAEWMVKLWERTVQTGNPG
ncbi:MAG: molybdopterin-guanine dinucleotide biosynthesis protein MobB [Myxococcota bacterium]|nr:molybdopterin-guanine dinucleotide biosynthesis protein MobB [Myxococcota bacterium]